MDPQFFEGFEEELRAILDAMPIERRLLGISPERLAAHLTPEQRLTGLDRDHQALALPIEVLRMLPDDYPRSLSPEIQAELRRRLRHGEA